MLFGVWVAVFLFLGFPSAWNKIFAVITGLLIIAAAYRLGGAPSGSKIEKQVPYVEHKSSAPAARDAGVMNDITRTDSSQN
jgi:hypothetical protein